MFPRDRVLAALDFRGPDVPPVEYHPSPAGIYEHGAKLRALWERYPMDFGDCRDFPPAAPDPRWIGDDGKYRELRRDEWGAVWEHLIFGVAGHPVERPLDDWRALPGFSAPAIPSCAGAAFEAARAQAAAHRRTHFLKSGWISIFEVMHAVRRFEDVLMDLAADVPEIHALADLITDYQLGVVRYLLQRGVDAVQFGDDFGTRSAPMMSLNMWKRFFKPRYRKLMQPVHDAGAKVFFHTCGNGRIFLEDLADLGVHAIWPQLNCYDVSELSAACRGLRIAVALHPDRGDLMVRGTPADVRHAVGRLAARFRVAEGGAWFYVEIDAGFPFENVEALIRACAALRRQPRAASAE